MGLFWFKAHFTANQVVRAAFHLSVNSPEVFANYANTN